MKIIAILPLEGSSHLKILSAGQTYYLSNNYTIDSKDKITEKSAFPSDFFSLEKVRINVQAVVGKNGSGKSTLMELLFRAVNNIAYHYQKIKIANLAIVSGLKVEIYYQTDTFYKVKIDNQKISFFKYDGRSGKINIRLKKAEIDLKDFFYSIVLNYSHYAYNDPDYNENKWIEGLFHKNDGYRTPLVLNPHRTRGNIDINSENHLVKSRLISNLLMSRNSSHFSRISSNLTASHLILKAQRDNKSSKTLYTKSKTRPQKFITYNDLHLNEQDLLNRLERHYRFNLKKIDHVNDLAAVKYILYKLVSIAIKYYNHEELYFSIQDDCFDESKLDDFFIKLYEDESHVTLKLRQTINFLKYRHIELRNQSLPLDELRNTINDIIAKNRKHNSKIPLSHIELIPPPIFNTEILLTPVNDKYAVIPFATLSSGEKQLIYSVSSILYHILNLESVASNTKKRTAYRHINVVLEEIEMYAHPEMQRTYIKYLIESIERLNLRRTQDVNIIFITHSPFILSDIPESNILFLNEMGRPEQLTESLKTFGGNIHDLLTTSFFLNHGAIGAFALEKINNLIASLNESSAKNISDTEKELLHRNIGFIAEPFLRNKLLDMYYAKFGKQKRIEQLEAELKKLKSND